MLCTSVVLGVCWAGPAVAAEVRESEDYVAVILEAEDHVTRDDRWVTTDATTDPSPEHQPDPDGNHSAGASGGVYLELLPDNQVDPSTPIPEGAPRTLWNDPGIGPEMSYDVDFPEPGRYAVHVRAFSTGTEDNGLHVGLNGEWPRNGTRLQFCTASARDWRWSDRKRDSGGGGSCGIPGTIWLMVEEAGPATFMVSAREDGFEMDRVMLIKDRSGNTRTCAPVMTEADAITCRDGGTEMNDGFVDLDVGLESAKEAGAVGDRFEVVARVGNRDRLDTAEESELVLAYDAEEWSPASVPAQCTDEEGRLVCALGEIEPGPVDQDRRVTVEFEALRGGLLLLEASATALEDDDTPGNDTAELRIDVEQPVIATVLDVSIDGADGIVAPGETMPLELSVGNTGDGEALDARVDLSMPAGLDVSALGDGCSESGGDGDITVECTLGTIEAGGTATVPLGVSSANAGDYALTVRGEAGNAPAVRASASVRVRQAVVASSGEETSGPDTASSGEGGADEGGTGGSATSGGTTGGGTTSGNGTGEGDAVVAGQEAEGSGTVTTTAAPSERRSSGGGSADLPTLLGLLSLVWLSFGFVRRRVGAADRSSAG